MPALSFSRPPNCQVWPNSASQVNFSDTQNAGFLSIMDRNPALLAVELLGGFARVGATTRHHGENDTGAQQASATGDDRRGRRTRDGQGGASILVRLRHWLGRNSRLARRRRHTGAWRRAGRVARRGAGGVAGLVARLVAGLRARHTLRAVGGSSTDDANGVALDVDRGLDRSLDLRTVRNTVVVAGAGVTGAAVRRVGASCERGRTERQHSGSGERGNRASTHEVDTTQCIHLFLQFWGPRKKRLSQPSLTSGDSKQKAQ